MGFRKVFLLGLVFWVFPSGALGGAKEYPLAMTVVADSVDSLELGVRDFEAGPSPFSPQDPWGLQLSYRVTSAVSTQAALRVDVFNGRGEKVYASDEVMVPANRDIPTGMHKADPQSPERLRSLAPHVWDGRDTRGDLCRNGPYWLRLSVRDGKGSRQYLRKVVLIK
jgi:hypothetical protein